MSTSSFQNKTSALFASVSRATIYTNASAMNSLNNNNVTTINNQPHQHQQSITMAANASGPSGSTASSGGFAKGLSLLASIGGVGGGHCNQMAAATQNSVGGSGVIGHPMTSSAATTIAAAAAAATTALNNNNNIYNNNQFEATPTNPASTPPTGSGGGGGVLSDNVVLSGNLRKLKTMKKKYFVLYRNAPNRPARLEYFDSEKKYRLHASHPKRSIRLEACFNINRRTDTKHKCVIALYTNEDCFCLVCDNEQELELWLHKMLSLQNNKDENGEPPKPTFAHVWSVEVQRRGLAQDKGLIGRYHLCLTDKSVTLNRYGPATSNGESRVDSVEFPMSTVRKGGHLNSVFYMELGRQNVLGAGELWVEAQDAQTAQTIHHSIINGSAKPTRPRSQSASQASKPIILRRPQTQQGTAQGIAPMNFSPSSGSSALIGMTGIPENSPNSRPASPNFSSCSSTASTVIPNTSNYKRILPGCSSSSDYIDPSAITAPDTVHNGTSIPSINGVHDHHNYPDPVTSATPTNANSSSSSNGVGGGGGAGIVMMVQAAVIIGPKDSNINYAGMAIKRERCDSLPSRNRTISDGNASSSLTSSTIMPPPKTIPSWNRPVSMCNRPSNSPISPSICSESDGSSIDEPDGLPQYTSGGTPDDNGSYFHRYAGPQGSAILEESDEYWSGDKFQKRVPGGLTNRTPSSSTPAAAASLSLPIAAGSSLISSHGGGNGLAKSIGVRSNGSDGGIHSSSAEAHSHYMEMYSPCSGSSPLDPTGNGAYMPMSPSVDVPRSLYTGSSSTHSRASSLTEENLDMSSRYVEMDLSIHNQSHASHNNRRHGGGGVGVGGHMEGGMSSAASSSSITSGTPSTDTRFADYPLEKVYSTFGPDDDENIPLSERPMRAYSVGSRLEHSKRKFRMDQSLSSSLASNSSSISSSRTRAYSVGSRAKMPRSDQYKSSFVGSPAQIALMNSVQHSQYNTGSMMMMPSSPLLSDANNNNNKTANTNHHNKKSSSVPMLDSFGPTSSGGGGSDVPLERVTDFMEIDFSSISIGKINEADDYVLSDNHTPLSQPSLEHDYLNMDPTAAARASKIIPEGYVEMRPVGITGSQHSLGMSNSPVRQQQTTSILTSNVINSSSKAPTATTISSSLQSEESDYLDMRGKDVVGSPMTHHRATTKATTMAASGSSTSSTNNEDYLNMAPLNRDLATNSLPSQPNSASSAMTISAEEGYLEMTFSRSNSIPQQPPPPSAAEFNAQQESYMKNRKLMTSNRSLPININYNSHSSAVPAPGMTPITPRNNLGLFSKLSSLEEAGTPSSGKKVVTTPTSVFPFSPASPATAGTGGATIGSSSSSAGTGKFQQRVSASPGGSSIGGAIGVGEIVTARKILVDGTTGTLKLSEDADSDEKKKGRRKVSTTTEESLDYVNYEPQPRRDSNRSLGSMSNGETREEEVQGDYVLMNPVTTTPTTTTTARRKSSTGGVGGQKSNFRPIHSSADQQAMDRQRSPAASASLLFGRQLSLNMVSETESGASGQVRCGEEAPYELLRTTSGGSGSDLSSLLRSSGRKGVNSRPSSVNSDKITSRISNLSLNRPNSANSDRLSTISSSSSSTSTLCGGNSSSSSSTTTLCGASGKVLMTRVPSDPSADEGEKSFPNKVHAASSVEKELHYASLDLQPSSLSSASSSTVSLAPLAKPEVEFANTVKRCRSSTDSSSAATTPSPSVLNSTGPGSGVPPANYAQLDWQQSAMP